MAWFILIFFFFFNGYSLFMSFSDSPAGKESAYNAGDPGLIPGSGRSAGEGMGYSLQDSWASFMAQLVKKVKVKSLGHV